MELVIPQNNVIAIVGPSATGKTTLARRLVHESPCRDTRIFHGDREMALIFAQSNFDCVDTIILRWVANCIVNIDMALCQGTPIVIDMPASELQDVKLLLDAMSMVGVKPAITLIKMYPSHDQQLKYATKRLQPNEYLNPLELKKQHEEFMEVAEASLHSEYPWILQEYLVSNPQDLQLRFPL